MSFHADFRLQLSSSQNFYLVVFANNTFLNQNLKSQVGTFHLFSQSFQNIQIKSFEVDLVVVLETELGNPALKGHLTTFKSKFALVSGSRLGTLVSASCCRSA